MLLLLSIYNILLTSHFLELHSLSSFSVVRNETKNTIMFDHQATLVETRDSALMSKSHGVDIKPPGVGKEQNCVDVLRRDVDTTLSVAAAEGPEDNSAGWLGGVATDFRNLALTIKRAVPPSFGAIGGAASFVHRTALRVANEIAQLECEDGVSDYDGLLPWEIMAKGETPYASSYYEEDEALKSKILALSNDDKTFLEPYSATDSTSLLVLDEQQIQLIRCLLRIDAQLATMHAHLSGKMIIRFVLPTASTKTAEISLSIFEFLILLFLFRPKQCPRNYILDELLSPL